MEENYMIMEKEKKIKKEILKLNKIFKNIAPNKKRLCEKLIQNAAFMSATLDELQILINETGAVTTSTNGNGFEVTQESPASKSYNTMINRYTSVIKQLEGLLPDAKADAVAEAGDALAAFVSKGKGIELR